MKLFKITGQEVQPIPERSFRDREFGALGEITLQEYLVSHPEILESEQIDRDDPPRFVVVRSEAGVTPGSIDVFLVDSHGVPTVIEAKLIDNREIRRSVLAQGIEYLSHLGEWTSERIQEAGRQFWALRNDSFDDMVQRAFGVTFDEISPKLAANLSSNRMRLIIAADHIPVTLLKSIEFINDLSDDVDCLGLEVKLFAADGDGSRILQPHFVGLSERRKRQKEAQRGEQWTASRFFEVLSEVGEEEESLAKDLLDFGKTVSRRDPEWGTGKIRGSVTFKVRVDGDNMGLFSLYTDGNYTINLVWYDRIRKSAVGKQLISKYADKCRQALGFDLNEKKTWVDSASSVMAPLSSLLPDRGAAFKRIIAELAQDLRLFPKVSKEAPPISGEAT